MSSEGRRYSGTAAHYVTLTTMAASLLGARRIAQQFICRNETSRWDRGSKSVDDIMATRRLTFCQPLPGPRPGSISRGWSPGEARSRLGGKATRRQSPRFRTTDATLMRQTQPRFSLAQCEPVLQATDKVGSPCHNQS
jgi:hypothetical protein